MIIAGALLFGMVIGWTTYYTLAHRACYRLLRILAYSIRIPVFRIWLDGRMELGGQSMDCGCEGHGGSRRR